MNGLYGYSYVTSKQRPKNNIYALHNIATILSNAITEKTGVSIQPSALLDALEEPHVFNAKECLKTLEHEGYNPLKTQHDDILSILKKYPELHREHHEELTAYWVNRHGIKAKHSIGNTISYFDKSETKRSSVIEKIDHIHARYIGPNGLEIPFESAL